jgi:2-keto-4-pentenoate hydratase
MSLSELTAQRRSQLRDAAEICLAARREGNWITELPEALRPTSQQEIYFVQDRIAEGFGELTGWKIGAPTPDAVPAYSPMPRALGFGATGTTLSANSSRHYRGVEAEIAFCLKQDLPPRSTPYTRNEIQQAIGSCHPAIEVLESAFAEPDASDAMSVSADLHFNGGFFYGAAVANWKSISIAEEKVAMIVDGSVRVEGTGSITNGPDIMRLLLFLANDAAPRTGGLKAGQWITTGSWTGKTLALSGSEAVAKFAHFGTCEIRFA